MGLVETLQQGSLEWKSWRLTGIGASWVPVLMGESDFDTPRGLWRKMTGREVEEENNFVMQRGLEAEPRIRAFYNLMTGVDGEPAIFQHPDVHYMRASLDNWIEDGSIIAEFKYPGKDKHEQAINGEVPPCYIGQLQAQLFVTGAKRADYCSYNGEGIAVVSVYPDPAYWARMLPVCAAFWECVQNDVPPPLTDRDYLEIDDSFTALVPLFQEWKRMKTEGGDLQEIRKKIIEVLPHPRVICDGVQVFQKSGKNKPTYNFKLAK